MSQTKKKFAIVLVHRPYNNGLNGTFQLYWFKKLAFHLATKNKETGAFHSVGEPVHVIWQGEQIIGTGDWNWYGPRAQFEMTASKDLIRLIARRGHTIQSPADMIDAMNAIKVKLVEGENWIYRA